MPKNDQRLSFDRYVCIPRTLIFLTRGDRILLLKGAPTKRLWANQYNGVGGHVEYGEDVLTAAKRELLEETGLSADLGLVGTLMVDVEPEMGVCLYIFSGESLTGEPRPSIEGTPEWLPRNELNQHPLVEDVAILLARIQKMQPGDPPFAAHSFYDEQERLKVKFGD